MKSEEKTYREVTLRKLIEQRRDSCYPPQLRSRAERLSAQALAVLFPHFAEGEACSAASVEELYDSLAVSLSGMAEELHSDWSTKSTDQFLAQLPSLQVALLSDARAMDDGDPASSGIDEVILTYPGFYAVALYRFAHALSDALFPILPRMITEYAHRQTGIDIHPSAEIGRSFCIDHGTGIVIGASADIGDNVRLYQGVTLGALVVEKALANRKRHPTLQDRVIVYANSTILGGETVIGNDTLIGANAWVTESVPPFSFVGRNAEVRPRKSTKGELPEFII